MKSFTKYYSQIKNLRRLSQKIGGEVLDEELLKKKKLAEDSFYEFVKLMWGYSGASAPFVDNWHMKAKCDHLQAVWEGRIRYLIINEPPRVGKSLVCSVLWPSWVWVKDAARRFITTSYSEDLASRDTKFAQHLIRSPLYQKFWGNDFALREKQACLLTNDQGGMRQTAGLGGGITGYGAWCVIVDDPNNVKGVETKSTRDSTNMVLGAVIPTRLDNQEKGAIVITQQRTHTEDGSGYILSKGMGHVVHLYLPMLFEEDHRCVTIPLKDGDKPWTDPRTYEGEPLCKTRFPEKSINEIREGLPGEYYWAGQYQQRPAPQGGGIIRTEWFRSWEQDDYPSFYFTFQSWDTAFTASEASSYSACTTWGLFIYEGVPNVMLLSMFRDKLVYPDLRHMVKRLYYNYHDIYFDDPIETDGPAPDMLMIEERASGYTLIQDLRELGIGVTPFNPKRKGLLDSSKEARAAISSHLIEAGRVWLPTHRAQDNPEVFVYPAYVRDFLSAAELFPRSDTRDIVDTMSMSLLWLRERQELWNPLDE